MNNSINHESNKNRQCTTQVNCDNQIFEQFPDNLVRMRSNMGMTTQPVDYLIP